jgi:methylmalonyl-CoA epimerase
MPRAGKLHHVGIVVQDLEQVEMMTSLLGLVAGRRTYVEEYEADCIFTEGDASAIEFIVPRGGKLARFNKGAGGLHHIAIEVDDLEALARRLATKGLELLEQRHVDAGPIRINFLPPAHTRGVIVEFVQPVPDRSRSGEEEPVT